MGLFSRKPVEATPASFQLTGKVKFAKPSNKGWYAFVEVPGSADVHIGGTEPVPPVAADQAVGLNDVVQGEKDRLHANVWAPIG